MGSSGLTREELEGCFERLEKPLFNVVYRWLWDADLSRDVVQDAFMRVWKKRAKVRPETLDALLFRTAVNLAKNRRRSRRLWAWLPMEMLDEMAGSEPDAHQQLIHAEQQAEVRAAIEALPDRLRAVVVLTELSGCSYAEVGEILGIKTGTVGSRRNAAMSRLRRSLGEKAAEESDHE